MLRVDPAAVWFGAGAGASVARTLLTPLSWGFWGGVALRNWMYDAGILTAHRTAVPALSVGNLTVGGTGKTPVAADLARRLRDAGARPAIVLRGYGGDEARVHAVLNPDIPVVTDADRLAGSAKAKSLGCDVVVLDDGFQHRRAARVGEVVLIAAEQWSAPANLLPAGPYREPRSSLRRASLVVVTRKSATAAASESVAAAVSAEVDAPVARAFLEPHALVRIDADPNVRASLEPAAGHASLAGMVERSIDTLRGMRVLAIAAIGSPSAFGRQLESRGADVELVSFPDHHHFSDDDVRALGRRATAHDLVVCTLKDAVKLATRWPRDQTPLWYVSQRLKLEAGEADIAACVRRVLEARALLA